MNNRPFPSTGAGQEDNPLTNTLYFMGNDNGGGSPFPPGHHGLKLTTGFFLLLSDGGHLLLAE